jgi:aspartate/methionine/tyrosine aminotransferase
VETPRIDLLEHLPLAAGLEIGDIARRGESFDIDPEELRRALRPDTGLVILSNPHNPSGAILSPERLRQLARVASEIGALVLTDEVYSDLAPGFAPSVSLASNLVTANSLTKSYGLFSLRCGWLLAQPALARRIEAANTRVEFGASKLAHAVAAHVMENLAPFADYGRDVLARNRPVLERHAAAMARDELIAGDLPDSGCMYFPRIEGCSDTTTLARRLWEEDRVLVAPGEFFGRAGHVRLGFGMADARLDEGLTRLHAGLKRIRDEGARPAASRAARVSR